MTWRKTIGCLWTLLWIVGLIVLLADLFRSLVYKFNNLPPVDLTLGDLIALVFITLYFACSTLSDYLRQRTLP